MCPSRIQIALPDITDYFANDAGPLLSCLAISEILNRNRTYWRLAQRTTVKEFIAYLVKHTKLEENALAFPVRTETRYSWGRPSPYELALSLRPRGYFSHYAAMALHDLTDQDPKTIYLNVEQSGKPPGDSPPTQARIDAAFAKPPRKSNSIAEWGDVRICLLSGKHTGALGVTSTPESSGRSLPVTDLERTLIDIVVRPFYAGGVFEVLNAYRRASSKVSVNRLLAYLKRLDYVYPYHQAIGFYLQKCGTFAKEVLDLLREIPFEFDFYLTHQMKETDYSPEWRLFVPKGF